jgi:hypothetical protein
VPSDPKIKDPADKLDYLIDWLATENGLQAAETITTSTWSAFDDKWVTTTELVVETGLSSHTTTTATGWVSAGLVGKKYYFTNHIVTSQGRELSWSITIKVKEQ